jgi:hypothetical protein
MQYNPRTVTEHDRSYAYNALWAGLPLSLLLLIGLQIPEFEVLAAVAGGFVCGTFIALVLIGNHDEFVRGQLSFAANWALCFAGLVLFAQVVPIARDYEPDTGLVLGIMAAIFHVALAYRRIRDR